MHGRSFLLYASPERVAVEQRRLRGDSSRECPERRGLDELGCEPVEAESEHRTEESDVRLEQPGGIHAQELVHDAERRNAPAG